MRLPVNMRAAVVLLAGLSTIAAPTLTEQASAAPHRAPRATHVTGADISWPQCPKGTGIPSRQGEGAPMPTKSARFVVVGVTNGPGFYPNPCLASQMRWVRARHVYAAAYAMTTYPRRKRVREYGARGPHAHAHLYGRLWNTGFAQARFNVATMRRTGLRSPIVWVDVEKYPVAPWTRNKVHNRAVVRGVVRGYRTAGYRVGFYSTQSQWHEIVGRLHYRFPEWHTAGETSMSSALAMCSSAPMQGGRARLAQWWGPKRDFDVFCPGTTFRGYFAKY